MVSSITLGSTASKTSNFWSGAKYHHDSTLEEWVGWTVIGVAKVDLASQVQCVQSCQSLKSSLRWYLNHNSDVTTVTITNDVPDREYNPILIWFWLTTVVSLVSFITSSTSPKPLRHHRKHKSKTTTNKNLQRCFHPGRSIVPQGQAGPHQWDGLKQTLPMVDSKHCFIFHFEVSLLPQKLHFKPNGCF